MITYVYLHGLHSSKESFKYKILQKAFNNTICIEWNEYSNINDILNQATDEIAEIDTDRIIIIGDSTGGNFACQLRNLLLNKKNIHAGLVLLNPLLTIEAVYDRSIINKGLQNYLSHIYQIEDAIIFTSIDDAIINHEKIHPYIKRNTNIIEVIDNHRFESFESFIQVIEKYAMNISL